MAWLGLVMEKHAELPSRGYLYQNSNFSVVKWTMERLSEDQSKYCTTTEQPEWETLPSDFTNIKIDASFSEVTKAVRQFSVMTFLKSS
jgi:hypothetical protein